MANKWANRDWEISDFYYEPTPEEIDAPLTEEGKREMEELAAYIDKKRAERLKQKEMEKINQTAK